MDLGGELVRFAGWWWAEPVQGGGEQRWYFGFWFALFCLIVAAASLHALASLSGWIGLFSVALSTMGTQGKFSKYLLASSFIWSFFQTLGLQ